MLKEFQEAAEKAQKKERLNHIMLVVAGIFLATGLIIFIRYTLPH